MSDTVIGIGVGELEDFAAFGQEVVDEVDRARAVIALRKDGWAVDLLSGQETNVYIYDDPESALFDCAEQIKFAWEQNSPEDGHLGHAAAGMWLFYWLAPDLSSMRQLVRAGRLDDLRVAAKGFIDSGFGAKRGPEIVISA